MVRAIVILLLITQISCRTSRVTIPTCATPDPVDVTPDYDEIDSSVTDIVYRVLVHYYCEVDSALIDAMETSIYHASMQGRGYASYSQDYSYIYYPPSYSLSMISRSTDIRESLTVPVYEEGYINVYVFPPDEVYNGYTYSPQSWAGMEDVQQFNEIYLTTEGVLNTYTLAHELGHFFNLPHRETCGNMMHNDCYRYGLDDDQLLIYIMYGYRNRQYLMK